MDYLQPQGFLGTGASLLADLTLMAYILLIVPGMIAGFVFARRGQHRPLHKYTMITITVANWLLIIFLMVAAYRFDVSSNIGSQPGNARYLMPTIHGILGFPAQLLATYVIYRMLREDTQVAAAKKCGETGQQLSKYWFKSAKVVMRVTIVLWLLTALLGVFNYLVRYDVLPAFGSGSDVPVVTAEPAATTEPSVTEEPAATIEPAATVEADDDEDDNDNSGSDNSNDNNDDDDDSSGSGSGEVVPAATQEAGS
ncbi:MAG: DUF420 domain-containing protein [Anaerolineae bacterium]|nr:DUF420 domain-containing protein [Anaerolineae bacterium]